MKYIAPLIIGLFAVGCANPKGATAVEQRDYVNKMHDDALAELYGQKPEAKEKVESAAGHGVFSYFGTNVVLVATEGGFGVVVDHATNEKTYMRLAGGGLGIGLGAKDARAVVVFKDRQAMDAFLAQDGKFTFGANTDALVKSDDKGGGKSGVAKTGQIQVYPLNRNGMALAASVIGTRFYRDAVLNGEAPESPNPSPATETVAETTPEDCEKEYLAAIAAEEEAAKADKANESETTADTQPADGYDD